MKKTMLWIVVAACAISFNVMAADAPAVEKKAAKKKVELTAEQKAAQKAIIEKYDENKDGKLDQTERAKMTQEDKAALRKAQGQAAQKKGQQKKPATQ